MNTLNHMATGALITLAIKEPVLALPLAFLSHFILDGLPHFGFVEPENNSGYGEMFKHKKLTVLVLSLDIVGIITLVYLLVGQTWLVFLAMFLAVLPDLKWPYRYFFFERMGKIPPKADPITHFHQKIQWGERPWGLVIEVPLAVLLLLLIWRLT